VTPPIPLKTWTITPNNRIPYVSLLDTQQRYLHGVKTFLKANGYTCKGSSSAGIGAMDGVDRWTTPSNVTPRATVAVASQAWIVLTDGNGCNILLAYQGQSDDYARISFSPSGAFIAAGTPSNQPTAVDECVIANASLIEGVGLPSGNADRLWFGWVTTDRKACRFGVARGGTWLGLNWGVESVQSTVVTTSLFIDSSAAWSPPVWGFAFPPASSGRLQSSTGIARVRIASVDINVTVYFGLETFAIQFPFWGVPRSALQGSVGVSLWPLSIGSSNQGAEGKLGNLIDWWVSSTYSQKDGETYRLRLVHADRNVGIIWPWDGVTYPQLT